MKSLKIQWWLWVFTFVGWSLIGVAYTYNYSHYSKIYKEIFDKQPRFKEMLIWELPYWLLWAMLTPLVFWLTRRFRLERGQLLRNLFIHLATCLALSLTHRLVYL